MTPILTTSDDWYAPCPVCGGTMVLVTLARACDCTPPCQEPGVKCLRCGETCGVDDFEDWAKEVAG